MKDKVVPSNSHVKDKKNEVEDHHRISSTSNNTKSVTASNDSLKSKTSNVNVVCATCGKCVFNSNHDACVSKYLNDVNARTKKPKVVPINSEFMLWNSLLLLECSSSSYFAVVSILKLTLPTGRYVVPTGRVIATDSVIVATSGYVVPAAYDISPGRVKVPAAHNTPLFISAASTNSKWSTADSKGQPSTVNYTTTSSSVDVSGNVLENVLHSFVAESFDKEGQVLSNVSELGHFAREFTGKEGGSKTRLIHAKWSNHEVTDMRKVLLMSMGSDCWILWGLIDGIPAVDAGRWMFLLLLSDAMMLENGISTHGVTLRTSTSVHDGRPGSDNQMEWMGEDGTVLRTSAGQSPYKLDISRDYQAFGVEMVKFTSKGLNQNKVLFTDSECLVLSKEFKLPDSSQSCCRVRGDKHLYCFNLANHPSGKGVSVLVGNRHPYLSPPMALMEGSCELQKHEQAGKRIVSSIFEPLQLLHMDLFGPTSIRSIDHKSYSLVVTDDFSRFSWVFFLGTKDETFYILRDFITFVENQLTKKVKAIRVLVTKPHNKTPYELLSGKVPNVSHFKPFGCHVTILNTSDHLGKFEGKADEGFLVGYSAHSKAIGYTRFKSNQPAGTQDTNNHAGTQDDSDSKSDEQLIVVPSFPSNHFSGPEVNHASDTHSLLVSINPAAGCSVVLIPPIFFYGVEPVHADDTPLPPGHSSGSSENSTRFPSLSDLTKKVVASSQFRECSGTEDIDDKRKVVIVKMKGEFEMSAMGELTFFLGLQVIQKPNRIFISQDKYVQDMLTKFHMVNVRSATTPFKATNPKSKDEPDEAVNVHLYRSMIGSLMYLTASRPDIQFVVSACSRHQVTPLTSHLNAVKRIFKYLKGRPKLGLWYPRDSPFVLEAYSDSDYAGSHGDRKSTTGGCQFLGRRLISWQCKKQTIVATSSTEAEYVAAANCCGQSTICIVKNPVFHQRTKHIEIRHHFIRDANEKHLIQVLKIHTDDNMADLLTKAFDGPRFNHLVVHIGMINP
ncbi:putative ribonuclease H-like domain-containing protein [Tanacetum coccineum]